MGVEIGGLLVPLVGASFVFVANAACFLLVILSVLQWKEPTLPPKASAESFSQIFGGRV
jgi:hypothetical protein